MNYKTVQSETSELGEVLFHAASLAVGTGDSAQSDALRQIAVSLRAIDKMRVYMDGGRSIKRLFEAARDCHERLKGWLTSAEA